MRPWNVSSILALGLLATSHPTCFAADRDQLRGLVLTAREKFAEMMTLRTIYYAKQELAAGVLQRTNYRRELEANIQNLRVTLDGYPARRTNAQQEVYNAWLAARQERTELDRQIGLLRSQMREIDEMVLSKAELTGKRPGPSNRRDILVVFPEVEKQYQSALDSLRSAISGATQDAQEGERLVQELNGELNRSSQIDARLGPPAEFYIAFRGQKKTAPARPKSKAVRKK